MRRPHLSRLTLGPGGLIGVALVLVMLGSGGALIVAAEIAARSGEHSSFFVEEGEGERFEEVVRVRSDDNAGTSVAFSRLAYPEDGGAGTVVIGRDDLFADNLAAGLLQSDGPLLLTDPRALNETVRAEIRRLGARSAYVVGGHNAVSPAVEQDLRAMGLGVTRLSGATRIETALAIATHVSPSTGKALLVRARDAAGGDSSQAWADSLAAGAYAAAAGVPVLLTETAALHPAVGDWLATHGVTQAYAIGGQAAIAPAVLEALAATGVTATRVSGAERAETAIAVAEQLWGYAGSKTATQIVLVDGYHSDSWAAGVSAAAFAARFRAPLVLANGSDVPAATERWIEQGGGRLVCGSSVEDDACDKAAAEPPPSPGEPTPTPTSTPTATNSPGPGPDPDAVAELTNDRPAQALFDLSGLLPTHTHTRRITVRNSGEVELRVRLHGSAQGDLTSALNLRVVIDPDGEARRIYDGTLDRFTHQHGSFVGGVGQHRLAPGQERVYEFTVSVLQGTGYEGSGATTAAFVWEGRA